MDSLTPLHLNALYQFSFNPKCQCHCTDARIISDLVETGLVEATSDPQASEKHLYGITHTGRRVLSVAAEYASFRPA